MSLLVMPAQLRKEQASTAARWLACGAACQAVCWVKGVTLSQDCQALPRRLEH